MNLELSLTKPGEASKKFQLNLAKKEKFKVKLSWDGQSDLDLHAVIGINNGTGVKISAYEDILSTYNVKRTVGGDTVGHLTPNSDGSFSTHNGGLYHSADARDGNKDDIDEYIEISPEKLSIPTTGALEIPIIAMIHPQTTANKFKFVQNAQVIIENAQGQVLLTASLTDQFGEFVGVQMGSIMIDQTSSNFVAVGVGFDSDFNDVLSYYC